MFELSVGNIVLVWLGLQGIRGSMEYKIGLEVHEQDIVDSRCGRTTINKYLTFID